MSTTAPGIRRGGRSVGTSYSLTYNAESRLAGVCGGATASFAYDADGVRVKATVNRPHSILVA